MNDISHDCRDLTLEFVPATFDDVDLFSDWEKVSLGWDIESTQLSCGPSRVTLDHVVGPEMLVGHFCSKERMRNSFSVPPGAVVLAIPRAKIPIHWCGRQVESSILAIVRSPQEHLVVVPAGWDSYEFMLTEDLIRRTGLIPPKFFQSSKRFEDAFIPLVEPVTAKFIQGLDIFFHRFRNANLDRGSAVRKVEFFNFVLEGLKSVVDAGIAARGLQPRRTRRADLIPRAELLIADHLSTEWTADEIAQALGVSYRVLNYAFQDFYGMSPYQYFLTERLHSARRQLRSSMTTVTEACLDHGFSTPSRFARQYKRLFGELPSETIRSGS